MVNDQGCLHKCYILSKDDPGIRELMGLKFCFITVLSLEGFKPLLLQGNCLCN